MVKTIYNSGPVRDFIVDEIKPLLMAGLNATGWDRLVFFYHAYQAMGKLPKPTKDNAPHHNSQIFIRARDHLFSHLNMPSREKELRALINFFIAMYEYDKPYREMVNELKAEIDKETWLQSPPKWLRGHGYWREECQ